MANSVDTQLIEVSSNGRLPPSNRDELYLQQAGATRDAARAPTIDTGAVDLFRREQASAQLTATNEQDRLLGERSKEAQANLLNLIEKKGGIDKNIAALSKQFDDEMSSWNPFRAFGSIAKVAAEQITTDNDLRFAYQLEIASAKKKVEMISQLQVGIDEAKRRGDQTLLASLRSQIDGVLENTSVDNATVANAIHSYQKETTQNSAQLAAFSATLQSADTFVRSIPEKLLEGAKFVCKESGTFLKNLGQGGGKYCWGAITGNEEMMKEGEEMLGKAASVLKSSLSMVGKGLKMVSDQLGLTDIGGGVIDIFANSALYLRDLCHGDMSSAKMRWEKIKAGGERVGKGFTTLVTEGLPLRAGKDLIVALWKGDWTAASIALIEVAIGLTALVSAVGVAVTTFGAGVAAFGAIMALKEGVLMAATTSLKTMAKVGSKEICHSLLGAGARTATKRQARELSIKNFFNVIGQDAVEKATKSFTPRRIEALATKVAKEGVDELGALAAKRGASAITKEVTSEIMQKRFGDMLSSCLEGNLVGRRGLQMLHLRRTPVHIIEDEIEKVTTAAAKGNTRVLRGMMRELGVAEPNNTAKQLCRMIKGKGGQEAILGEIRGSIRNNLEKKFVDISEKAARENIYKAIQGELKTAGGEQLHAVLKKEALREAELELGAQASKDLVEKRAKALLKKEAEDLAEAGAEGAGRGIKFKAAEIAEDIVKNLAKSIRKAAKSPMKIRVPLRMSELADSVSIAAVLDKVGEFRPFRDTEKFAEKLHKTGVEDRSIGGKIQQMTYRQGQREITKKYEVFSDGHIRLLDEQSRLVDEMVTPRKKAA